MGETCLGAAWLLRTAEGLGDSLLTVGPEQASPQIKSPIKKSSL